MKKGTPSNCKFKKCRYNVIPPGEDSQECIGCDGNKAVKGGDKQT
ncbi:MAG: hypothetical protein PHI12_13345 [Dehalococcoidales bacterium]|nr:hypothetical protein [Dehalococcoidales bacterium]